MQKVQPPIPALLLVRHAKAERTHPYGDVARGLTREGRAAFRVQAKVISRLSRVRAIYTSPSARAVQTAEILAAELGQDGVEIREELSPRWRATSKILEMCLELPAGSALVGHNPSLSEVASELLGLRELPFKFKKGGALALKRQGKAFGFLYFAAPDESVVEKI